MNEKNFVGLSAHEEFIACGSEQNEASTCSSHTQKADGYCLYMFAALAWHALGHGGMT